MEIITCSSNSPNVLLSNWRIRFPEVLSRLQQPAQPSLYATPLALHSKKAKNKTASAMHVLECSRRCDWTQQHARRPSTGSLHSTHTTDGRQTKLQTHLHIPAFIKAACAVAWLLAAIKPSTFCRWVGGWMDGGLINGVNEKWPRLDHN